MPEPADAFVFTGDNSYWLSHDQLSPPEHGQVIETVERRVADLRIRLRYRNMQHLGAVLPSRLCVAIWVGAGPHLPSGRAPATASTCSAKRPTGFGVPALGGIHVQTAIDDQILRPSGDEHNPSESTNPRLPECIQPSRIAVADSSGCRQ